MSSVIIEVIILIASTLLAGSFATYAIFCGNLIQNNVSLSVDSLRQQMNTEIRMVYVTLNESERCFVIYAR